MYNPYLSLLIIMLIAGVLIYYVFNRRRKSKFKSQALKEDEIYKILKVRVPFFSELKVADQKVFQERVSYFLNKVKISAEKGAEITHTDLVLVAASATIPLFHFENWSYENLEEVLLYPDYFDAKFDTEKESDRNIAGMVGTGALNHKMILSLPALRSGFNSTSEGNTAIHEFVHLIDKADGMIDGIPEYLIPVSMVEPWIKEMHKTIKEIHDGQSDIREYATTNEAEFLAVVSEYFFKKPHLLQKEHPKLYALLDEIYNKAK